jgi:hypothetical protein
LIVAAIKNTLPELAVIAHNPDGDHMVVSSIGCVPAKGTVYCDCSYYDLGK